MKGPELLAEFFAHFIAKGSVSLGDLLQEILQVPPLEEDGDAPLVEAMLGTSLVFAIMSRCVTLSENISLHYTTARPINDGDDGQHGVADGSWGGGR